MTEWKTYKLSEIGTIVGGATPSTSVLSYYGGAIPWLTPKDLSNFQDRYIEKGERNITQEGLDSCSAQLLPANAVLFSSRAPIGYVAIAKNPIATNQGFKSIIPNEKVDSLFLYYILKYNKDKIEAMGSGTTFKEVSGAVMKNVEISLPSLEEQRRIAGILGAIDDKIENNRRINTNLELQAQALYKQWFVDNRSDDWEVGKVSDYYDITIGKTPPRKEKQWFSLNSQNTTWVSISDMGTCGMYISDSSEYLTADAVSRFNIKEVSPNTVLLSFKLTIGRVAISNGVMTTNEAIAHFNTERDYLLEYTYLALKAYEFSNLGSTSSIATAVNSKIIKAMRWIMPEESMLRDFHNLVSPIFRQIKNNILENENLTTLRDTLLPKLMSGEIKTE